jgi:hypothetical protein
MRGWCSPFTMASMVFSDLRIIGQVGTTIATGLLFDTLIVRSFMTPSIAAPLGRWFWWPQIVRPRPASQMLRSVGPRAVVRALLLHDEYCDDDAVTTELPIPPSRPPSPFTGGADRFPHNDVLPAPSTRRRLASSRSVADLILGCVV